MTVAEAGPSFASALPGGVRVRATTDPASPLLRRFFAGYDRAFVLPDEREDFAGFQKCLALNATHRRALGRQHCEIVAVLEDVNGVLLGGANFLATSVVLGPAEPSATVALNYVYVEEAARGRGLLRQALVAVKALALESLGLDRAGPAPAVFIEQNDPLRMSAEAYRADSEHCGLDQLGYLVAPWRSGGRLPLRPAATVGRTAAGSRADLCGG